ncbi:hypothetical protein [Litorihabitans aurantiacus]|nr:hypothetical protein [Litorihabitans aurantiacus]
MLIRPPLPAPARPLGRVMTHIGTNGYVSSWGEDLSGVQPAAG